MASLKVIEFNNCLNGMFNGWSDLILCVSDEITITDNINDYMCRVQCFRAIVQNTGSITFF